GFRPDVRGMHGPTISFDEFIRKAPAILKPKAEGGILDHTGVVECVREPGNPTNHGGNPNFIWVFVIVRCKTKGQEYWVLKTKGIKEGNVGILFSTFHHGSIQAPVSIAMAAIDHRAVIAPLAGNKRAADCITMAKMDLAPGTVIDEIGGYHTTGRIEIASTVRNGSYLPFSLAAGAKVVREVKKEGFLTYDDVEFMGKPSVLQHIRGIQDRIFGDLY
ncbi:MAG: hypothetical protein PHO15_11825, partial [Eubacteriales bacterium]|nr:hypothetical protein [Eubacteriales bacterium]